MPIGPVSSRFKGPDYYMNYYMEMPESGRDGGRGSPTRRQGLKRKDLCRSIA
jgi:hypothetical protein